MCRFDTAALYVYDTAFFAEDFEKAMRQEGVEVHLLYHDGENLGKLVLANEFKFITVKVILLYCTALKCALCGTKLYILSTLGGSLPCAWAN